MTTENLDSRVTDLETLVSRLNNTNAYGELRYGQPKIGSDVPLGAVLFWSGSVATIPSGYALCDGTNGTSDLRGLFIVGAGGSYNVGDTGGSATQANHVITQPNNHSNHVFTQPNQHTNTGSGHIHTLVSGATLTAPGGTPNVSSQTDSQGLHTHDVHTGGGVDAHSVHTGVTVNAHGTNLPPYYALAFIQRIS